LIQLYSSIYEFLYHEPEDGLYLVETCRRNTVYDIHIIPSLIKNKKYNQSFWDPQMGRGSTRIRLDDDRFKPDLLKKYCPRNAVPASDIISKDYVRQVKLSLSVIKHYAMKTDKIMDIRLHTFIASALPLCVGGCVNPRDSLFSADRNFFFRILNQIYRSSIS